MHLVQKAPGSIPTYAALILCHHSQQISPGVSITDYVSNCLRVQCLVCNLTAWLPLSNLLDRHCEGSCDSVALNLVGLTGNVRLLEARIELRHVMHFKQTFMSFVVWIMKTENSRHSILKINSNKMAVQIQNKSYFQFRIQLQFKIEI